ncbi:MAG: CHAD domain-containing protein, partial [Hyphomicrobiales bacterium]|nr:CHAD domain-containing protein [Hyphomicrobiales bacterium]
RPGGDLGQEIRRLGCEQIGQASTELSGSAGLGRGVHEARKCIKRTRALLSFARPGLSKRDFTKHDRRLRTISRSLAPARDWQAMLECLDRLDERFGKGWNPDIVGALRAGFQGRKQRAEAVLSQGTLEKTARQLKKAHRRFAKLDVDGRKLSVGRGLEPAYARGRKRFWRACRVGDGRAYHDWRKEAQRHWRHMQLLVAAWPDEMAVRTDRARALSQCLGDDHDLHILLGYVGASGPDIGSWRDLERFYDGCIEQQFALRMAARSHGQLLFTERPPAFRRRISGYWRAASERYSQGARLPATILQDCKVVPIRPARPETDRAIPPTLVGE